MTLAMTSERLRRLQSNVRKMVTFPVSFMIFTEWIHMSDTEMTVCSVAEDLYRRSVFEHRSSELFLLRALADGAVFHTDGLCQSSGG
jgi:hypothetical protein